MEAWLGALLFSFVIYFDFSGYSDMAIGLARLFNVRFPENFASPYKATSIIDFWRRWHITLSSFLRDYLYIPLGGRVRRYRNLLLTMLLGGLLHGAGWTFVLWGGLHGLYLVAGHLWAERTTVPPTTRRLVLSRVLTYVAVVVAWVLFRSSSLEQALTVYGGMLGLHGLSPQVELPSGALGNGHLTAVGLAVVLLAIVNFLPNTQQFMALFRPVIYTVSKTSKGLQRLMVWRLTFPHIAFVSLLGIYAMTRMEVVQTFIYFRF